MRVKIYAIIITKEMIELKHFEYIYKGESEFIVLC